MVAVLSQKRKSDFYLDIQNLLQRYILEASHIPRWNLPHIFALYSEAFPCDIHSCWTPSYSSDLQFCLPSAPALLACKGFCPLRRLLISLTSHRVSAGAKQHPGEPKPVQEVSFKEINFLSHLSHSDFFLPSDCCRYY